MMTSHQPEFQTAREVLAEGVGVLGYMELTQDVIIQNNWEGEPFGNHFLGIDLNLSGS